MTYIPNDTKTFTVALTTPCPMPSLAFRVTSISGMTATVKVTTCNPGGAYIHWKTNQPSISGEDDNVIEGVRVGTYEYTFRSYGPKTLTLIGENECGKSTGASRNLNVSDPCAGITCNDTCDGTSLWSQKCVNGKCVRDAFIKPNATECGYVAPTPAHGQIEEPDYPVSVNHGADVRVTFNVHNTGGSTGTFIARLYQGNTKVGVDWRVNALHAGNNSSGAITVKAPTTGTSVTYTLKSFLRT